MAINRCIELRLAEAVRAILAADADLSAAAMCGDRIYIGPIAAPDASFIQPHQINIRPIPSDDAVGINGVDEATFRIRIVYFEPALKTASAIAAGSSSTGFCVMAHIEKLLIIGNGTSGDAKSQLGRLTDPDDATGTLNVNLPAFHRSEGGLTENRVAYGWVLDVDYTVKQTKLRALAN